VDSIEANYEWAKKANIECENNQKLNGSIIVNIDNIKEGLPDEELPKYMSLIPNDKKYDVVSIDGIYRTEIVQWAVNHLKGRGGFIICDNWQQDYIWISPSAEKMLSPFKMQNFIQPDHTGHEGRPWATAVFYIN